MNERRRTSGLPAPGHPALELFSSLKGPPMLSCADAASIAAAPTLALNDPVLRKLLVDRVHDWSATGLLAMTHLVMVGPGDFEKDIVDEVAFSPLVSSIDAVRFGSPAFQPPFDWLEAHPGWFELIRTVGNE